MSGTGGADIVHGAQLPTPRWWRRYRDIPLVVLTVLSIVAALVGWVAQYRIDEAGSAPAAVVPSSRPVDASSSSCRAPLNQRAGEPWIEDSERASAVWQSHADELAGPVVLGRDGWAFYNDQVEENFSQAVGRRYLTVTEVGAWRDYFTALRDGLAEQGVDLSIQITPSASSVYPDKLPEWTDGIVGSTPLDQLLASAPDLPIIDFRHDLRIAAGKDAVYTPVNSHWTDWGGYIGWRTVAACELARHPDVAPLPVPAVTGVESTRVYNEYAGYGVPDATPEWTVPVFGEALHGVTVTAADGTSTVADGADTVDLAVLPAETVTEAAGTERTALILRDSMGSALSPYWGQAYARTWQIQHRYDDWSNPPNYRALVAEHHPSVVIVQMAERHLVNAPAAGVGPGY